MQCVVESFGVRIHAPCDRHVLKVVQNCGDVLNLVWEFWNDPDIQAVKYVSQIFSQKYRKISDISGTKLANINVSHLVLQFSLPNPLKPWVKSRMKM